MGFKPSLLFSRAATLPLLLSKAVVLLKRMRIIKEKVVI
jgi:hypothetical protein